MFGWLVAVATLSGSVAVNHRGIFDIFDTGEPTFACAGSVAVTGKRAGRISDALKDADYPKDGRDCSWLIEAYPAVDTYTRKPTLTLSFITVELPKAKDGVCSSWVKVYEGCTSDESLLKGNTFCGDTLPPRITSQARCLLVSYHSEVDTKGRGFEATFRIDGIRGVQTFEDRLLSRARAFGETHRELDRMLKRTAKMENTSAARVDALVGGLVGPAGARGARGAPGPGGPEGPRGPQGNASMVRGPTGLRGVTGPAGEKGNDGDDGDNGATGMTGMTGATGPTGMSAHVTGEEPRLRGPIEQSLRLQLGERIRQIAVERGDVQEQMTRLIGNKFNEATAQDLQNPYAASALPTIVNELAGKPHEAGMILTNVTSGLSSHDFVSVFKDHIKQWAQDVFRPSHIPKRQPAYPPVPRTTTTTPPAAKQAVQITTPPARALDPRAKRECDLGAYAQCMSRLGPVATSEDPKKGCSHQRRSYGCLEYSGCTTSATFAESVKALIKFMRQLRCHPVPPPGSLMSVAAVHCNDGPSGFTLDDPATGRADCGCDGSEQRVNLSPPDREDVDLSDATTPAQRSRMKKATMCAPRGARNTSHVYPTSACDAAEVEAVHECIKRNTASFCEACLPLFEVVEFCLATDNAFVTIGARHTENLVHEIWRKKCVDTSRAAAETSDSLLR